MLRPPVERYFAVQEAKELLEEARRVADELIVVRAELAERSLALRGGDRTQLPEVKGLEAQLSEHLDWFTQRGIQTKGYAPLLLDFPMRHKGRVVLLCWLENEPSLAWYHDAELGFMGRRPLGHLGPP